MPKPLARSWCPFPVSDEPRGVTYWLWEEEQAIQCAIEGRTEDTERLEADIVKARAKRDELRLLIVEMRAARQLLESAGLKVERIGSDINVSIERPLVREEATSE